MIIMTRIGKKGVDPLKEYLFSSVQIIMLPISILNLHLLLRSSKITMQETTDAFGQFQNPNLDE